MNLDIAIRAAINADNGILPSDLRNFTPCRNPKGKPRLSAGGFCLACQMQYGTKLKCFRFWYNTSAFNEAHVKRVAQYIQQNNVSYFNEFNYYEKCLKLVDGNETTVIPGVVMNWTNAKTLIQYINDNHTDSNKIKGLAQEFFNFASYMNDHGIAHGDLAGKNILVSNDGKISLVDYDSFYVPGIAFKQVVAGTDGFQHRERKIQPFYTKTMDYFSQQVIYLSLIALAEAPDLVQFVGDKELLFTDRDFESESAFSNSNVHNRIREIKNTQVQLGLTELCKAVAGKYEDIKPITEIYSSQQKQTSNPKPLAEKGVSSPTYMPHCIYCGKLNNHNGQYCTNCGKPRIRRVPPEETTLSPTGTTLSLRCPDCKTSNLAQAKHCRQCGKPLKKTTTLSRIFKEIREGIREGYNDCDTSLERIGYSLLISFIAFSAIGMIAAFVYLVYLLTSEFLSF